MENTYINTLKRPQGNTWWNVWETPSGLQPATLLKRDSSTSAFLQKLLRAPFSTQQLLWLLFNISNSLFKDVSAISLIHSQSLITCNSHNDKLIWKSIHLPNLDINNFAVLLHFVITKFSRNCPYFYFVFRLERSSLYQTTKVFLAFTEWISFYQKCTFQTLIDCLIFRWATLIG